MAKLPNNSLLSGASGKIGDLVLYMSNGIQIVRTRPQRKDYKPSEFQKAHIESFKAQHVFAKSIKRSVIDRIWSRETIPAGMNPYNFFFKSNRDAFGKTELIKFPQLMTISTGRLLPVEDLTIKKADNKIYIQWKVSGNMISSYDRDKLNIAFLIDKKRLHLIDTSITRATGQAEIGLDDLQPEIVEGYIFWASEDDKAFSRSEYWKIG